MKRIAKSVQKLALPLQIKFLPVHAHWFILDSLLLANHANREGMHANALALTRQCLEAISVIESGLSAHPDAPDVLMRWDRDKISPGEVRKWLSANIWPSYSSGLWSESWPTYMTHLARAVQPYAHYTSHLAADVQEELDLKSTRIFLMPISTIGYWGTLFSRTVPCPLRASRFRRAGTNTEAIQAWSV